MPIVSFDALPDHGRLWVFPANRDLAEAEAEALFSHVDEFLAQWAAHGVPLRSARRLVEGRFLLVGVDIDAERPSGCSIDALVNRLRALGQELNANLIDHSSVWFRDSAGIQTVSRAEFRELSGRRSVVPETRVFDTSLTRVDQARKGELEKSASESWHGRTFFPETAAG